MITFDMKYSSGLKYSRKVDLVCLSTNVIHHILRLTMMMQSIRSGDYVPPKVLLHKRVYYFAQVWSLAGFTTAITPN